MYVACGLPFDSQQQMRGHQLVDNDLEGKVNVIVGTFVVVCLASAFTFGLDSIIACIIGLFVIAAILQVFRGGANG
jgi:divalent metal cation (Fe/Co/Zn/Cd) transporter